LEDMKNPIRLLICSTCHSVEELPPYSGDPRGDTWLRNKEANHLLPSGEKMHGDVRVGRIEQSDWLSHKDEILNKVAAELTLPGEGTGFGQQFYDTKDNFSLDAMKCWRVDHGRTMDCDDYRSSKKKLLPDTRAERKAEGLDYKHRPNTFLCDFCPYHSVVLQRQNRDKFSYDYSS